MATQVTTPDATAPQSPQPQPRDLQITESQKQALIDNLQLEISDRARKLRAQYALQAQGLRNRLEMRINRIPHTLRRANMADLLQRHTDALNKPLPSPPKNKSLKRKSDDLRAAHGKENSQPAPRTLDNPKKRSKPNPAPSGIPTSPNLSRSTRQPMQPLTTTAILSPKSPNSRSIPRSPIKSPASTKSPPPLPRPRAQQLAQAAKARGAKRPATAPTTTTLNTIAQAPPPQISNINNTSDSETEAPLTAKKSAVPTRPQTAMAASPKKATIPVSTKPSKPEKKEKSAPVQQIPAPASVQATPAAVGTVKKGTFKSAMASLTGSKRGKKGVPAATAGAASATAPATPPQPAGRVLRKRAP